VIVKPDSEDYPSYYTTTVVEEFLGRLQTVQSITAGEARACLAHVCETDPCEASAANPGRTRGEWADHLLTLLPAGDDVAVRSRVAGAVVSLIQRRRVLIDPELPSRQAFGTKVWGQSDDNIYFEGDINGQVSHCNVDEQTRGTLLLFSDGTMAQIYYDKFVGTWGVTVFREGDLFVRVDQCISPTERAYSDQLFFRGGIEWVYSASEWGKVQ